MLVEVDVPNEDARALSRHVRDRALHAWHAPTAPPTVPDDALVFRGGKVYVPVVRDSRLVLAEVALGYDDGRKVEITSGIDPDDMIAMNVGQSARDGELVHAVPLSER